MICLIHVVFYINVDETPKKDLQLNRVCIIANIQNSIKYLLLKTLKSRGIY